MNATAKSEESRRRLLEIAAEEIHENGFQATSVGDILTRAGVSKGALYHHFPSKLALGYAVLEEVFLPDCESRWAPALSADDPITGIRELLQEGLINLSDDEIRVGCPINNLAQEMSPIDEGFRLRVSRAIGHWRSDLSAALERGQENGIVASHVDPAQIATLFIASMEGGIGLAKNAQDRALLKECTEGLINLMEGLRA